jgi:uncharacterized protein (UPF0332 family)
MGRTLNYAFGKRIVGDYGMGASVAQEEAEDLLAAAHDFVRTVKGYLGTWTQGK